MIRVLVAGRSPTWQALRRALAAADDFEVVGTADTPMDLLAAAGATGADVVVIDAGGKAPPGIVSHLLAEYPEIKVVGVARGGRGATVYFLQPQQVRLAGATAADLVRDIRNLLHQGGAQT